MNRPQTVINYVNIAHFIDHYAMLIFAAAVIVMSPVFGLPYGDLLPYATPGFVALARARWRRAGSAIAGAAGT